MERSERVISKDLKREFKAHKEKLLQSHRVKRRVDAIQEAARKLVSAWLDVRYRRGASLPPPAPCSRTVCGSAWARGCR